MDINCCDMPDEVPEKSNMCPLIIEWEWRTKPICLNKDGIQCRLSCRSQSNNELSSFIQHPKSFDTNADKENHGDSVVKWFAGV